MNEPDKYQTELSMSLENAKNLPPVSDEIVSKQIDELQRKIDSLQIENSSLSMRYENLLDYSSSLEKEFESKKKSSKDYRKELWISVVTALSRSDLVRTSERAVEWTNNVLNEFDKKFEKEIQ